MRFLFLILFGLSTNVCSGQDYTIPDSIATVQSCNAFGSINDGHPSTPYFPFFQGVFELVDNYEYGICIAHTFSNQKFLRNSLFTLSLTSGSLSPEFKINNSFSTMWQQRWTYEKGNLPTIATLFYTNVPYGEEGQATEYGGIFMVIKNMKSSGVLYFNSFLDVVEGEYTMTKLLGYKKFITNNTNVLVDVLYAFDKAPTLELAYEYNFESGSVISPGLSYNYDSNLNKGGFVFGLSLLYQTN